MTQSWAKRIHPVHIGSMKKFSQLGHNGKQKALLLLPLGQFIHLHSFWWTFKWFPSLSFHFSTMNILRHVSWCACEWFLIHLKGDCWVSERVNFQLYKIMSNSFSKGYPKSHTFFGWRKMSMKKTLCSSVKPHSSLYFLYILPSFSFPVLESWNIRGRRTFKNVQFNPFGRWGNQDSEKIK